MILNMVHLKVLSLRIVLFEEHTILLAVW